MDLNLFNLPKPNSSEFRIITAEWYEREVILINPAVKNPTWEPKNLWFRSSIWDKATGAALSLGFPKFFNFNELPQKAQNLEHYSYYAKMDGSLLIIDKVPAGINLRPRGSFNIEKHLNKEAIYNIVNQSKIKEAFEAFPDHSLLFEVVDPEVKIIIEYTTIEIIFVGAINKYSGELMPQARLDKVATQWGWKRPEEFIPDPNQVVTLNTIKNAVNIEGFCAYSPDGQTVVKLKTDWYRRLHSFKSHCTITEVLNWFCENLKEPEPGKAVRQFIGKSLDWECVEYAEPMIQRIEEYYTYIQKNMAEAKALANSCKNLSGREFSEILFHRPTLKKYAFPIYNGKEIDHKIISKELENMYKKDLHAGKLT